MEKKRKKERKNTVPKRLPSILNNAGISSTSMHQEHVRRKTMNLKVLNVCRSNCKISWDWYRHMCGANVSSGPNSVHADSVSSCPFLNLHGRHFRQGFLYSIALDFLRTQNRCGIANLFALLFPGPILAVWIDCSFIIIINKSFTVTHKAVVIVVSFLPTSGSRTLRCSGRRGDPVTLTRLA